MSKEEFHNITKYSRQNNDSTYILMQNVAHQLSVFTYHINM